MYIAKECAALWPVTFGFPKYSIYKNRFGELIKYLQVSKASKEENHKINNTCIFRKVD